jgi:hypothetical protein
MEWNSEKWGILLWIFAGRREIGGVYWSVIGHRLRVGAAGVKGKVQEWCRLVWMEVEMWKGGSVESGGMQSSSWLNGS